MKNLNKSNFYTRFKKTNLKKKVEKIIKKYGYKMYPMTLKF